MALRLRVISDHRQRLGDKSTFVFGVSGGSIGRSAENDWVLPDDMRYVSGRHARVVFHKGRWLLQDTSSNGTFVNDNDRPLGSQNPHELKSGDVLRIGEYHVQVQIDSATDFTLDDLNGFNLQAWATTAFLITSTISTPLYGTLSDISGRRPFFLFAIR